MEKMISQEKALEFVNRITHGDENFRKWLKLEFLKEFDPEAYDELTKPEEPPAPDLPEGHEINAEFVGGPDPSESEVLV